jgi:hypothetical protein
MGSFLFLNNLFSLDHNVWYLKFEMFEISKVMWNESNFCLESIDAALTFNVVISILENHQYTTMVWGRMTKHILKKKKHRADTFS